MSFRGRLFTLILWVHVRAWTLLLCWRKQAGSELLLSPESVFTPVSELILEDRLWRLKWCCWAFVIQPKAVSSETKSMSWKTLRFGINLKICPIHTGVTLVFTCFSKQKWYMFSFKLHILQHSWSPEIRRSCVFHFPRQFLFPQRQIEEWGHSSQEISASSQDRIYLRCVNAIGRI